MATFVFITFFLVISSIPSILFLLEYRRLVRFGTQTKGEVVGYEVGRFILARTIPVPKVSFKTDSGKTVTMKPTHTFLASLHWYPVSSTVRTYYQHDNPECFVIRNITEVFANCWIVLFAIGCIIGLVIG